MELYEQNRTRYATQEAPPEPDYTTPRTFYKDGQTRVANTRASENDLIAEGWGIEPPEQVSTEEPERRIVEGADGFKYYEDTGERVLPSVTLAERERRPTETAASIRGEFRTQSKVFIDTQDSFRRVIRAADRDSAAGDISLVFNYMKTLDPESVVRESEFSLAQNAGNYGQRVQAAVSRIVNGERLTPEQRADFVETAKQTYYGQAEQQQRQRSQYEGIVQAAQLDPNAALINYIDADLYQPQPAQPGRSAATRPTQR